MELNIIAAMAIQLLYLINSTISIYYIELGIIAAIVVGSVVLYLVIRRRKGNSKPDIPPDIATDGKDWTTRPTVRHRGPVFTQDPRYPRETQPTI